MHAKLAIFTSNMTMKLLLFGPLEINYSFIVDFVFNNMLLCQRVILVISVFPYLLGV